MCAPFSLIKTSISNTAQRPCQHVGIPRSRRGPKDAKELQIHTHRHRNGHQPGLLEFEIGKNDFYIHLGNCLQLMGAGYRSSYTRRKFRLRYEFSLQQARLADAVTSKVLLTWHKRSQVFFSYSLKKIGYVNSTKNVSSSYAYNTLSLA